MQKSLRRPGAKWQVALVSELYFVVFVLFAEALVKMVTSDFYLWWEMEMLIVATVVMAFAMALELVPCLETAL